MGQYLAILVTAYSVKPCELGIVWADIGIIFAELVQDHLIVIAI